VSHKIKQLYVDSANAELQNFRGKVDFVFVDGDHGYNYVKSDSESAFSMLTPSGVILWHDYASRWEDVTRFLREVANQQGKRIYHLQGTNLAVYARGASLPE
jgi:predicted O-methyltransferase YrrM